MTDVVMFGLNRVGERIYEWLLDAEATEVQALITDESQYDTVETLEPQYIVSAGFRHVIPEWVLNIPEQDAINCHLSYLPYNRGMNPNVWSIVEESPAGVSIHTMTPSVDLGPIIDRRQIDITPDDTGKSHYNRLERAMFELFVDRWPDIRAGDIEQVPQEAEAGSYHYKEAFHDLCELDLDETVQVRDFIDRLRALTFPPYRNAYVDIGDDRYYIELSITHEDDIDSNNLHWNMPEYED